MVSPSFLYLLAGVIPVLSSAVKPLIAHEVKRVDVPERRHLDIDSFSNLQRRDKNLGTFNLAKTFPANDVLIQVALGKSSGAVSGSLALTATCIDCHTTGTAVVTTDGVQKDDDILGDIFDFITSDDKTDIVAKALGMDLKVDLENFGGHFEFDISFAASGTYTVTLFKSETPVGVELDDSNKIGLIFTIELTLTVSAAVDFTTGFDVLFPPGTSFTLNPINGDLVSMNIGGAKVNSIPVKFKSGAACIAAVLRLKFQAGVALKVFDTGFDFESAVFFDPLQYKACVKYQPTLPCPLEFTENFFEEIGAFARAVVDLDFAKLSIGPTAVSTFFTGALPSQCLSTFASSASSSKVLSTTAPPAQHTKSSISVVLSTTVPPAKTSTSGSTHTTAKATSKTKIKNNGTATAISGGGSPGNKTSTSITPTTSISGGAFIQPTGVSKFGTGSAGDVYTQPTGSAPYGNSSSVVVTMPTDIPSTSLENSGVTASEASMTTDTITYTSIYTITSCKPEVTNCPARIGQVTSEVITTTTLCPVSAASSNAGVASTPAPTGTDDLTTRTIFATSTYTITSCLSNIVHCPASLASDVVQTKTVLAYTTVCPVSQTDFPTAIPLATAASQVATSAAVLTSAAPKTYTVKPVPLTPCPTPIVKTFDTYAPLPTIVPNITVPYPILNSTSQTFPTASAAPSASLSVKSTAPIVYSNPNGLPAKGYKAEMSAGAASGLPSNPISTPTPVTYQAAAAMAKLPRFVMLLGTALCGLFAVV